MEISDHRPLVSVDTARAVLNLDEDSICDLIDSGRLQYAWHIESPGASKLERRIHRDSLRCYQLGICDAATETEYYASIFQHSRPNVRISEIFRALNCSSRHALELWRAGCFEIPNSEFRIPHPQTGHRTSPLVPRAAVLAFLKSRRLP